MVVSMMPSATARETSVSHFERSRIQTSLHRHSSATVVSSAAVVPFECASKCGHTTNSGPQKSSAHQITKLASANANARKLMTCHISLSHVACEFVPVLVFVPVSMAVCSGSARKQLLSTQVAPGPYDETEQSASSTHSRQLLSTQNAPLGESEQSSKPSTHSGQLLSSCVKPSEPESSQPRMPIVDWHVPLAWLYSHAQPVTPESAARQARHVFADVPLWVSHVALTPPAAISRQTSQRPIISTLPAFGADRYESATRLTRDVDASQSTTVEVPRMAGAGGGDEGEITLEIWRARDGARRSRACSRAGGSRGTSPAATTTTAGSSTTQAPWGAGRSSLPVFARLPSYVYR